MPKAINTELDAQFEAIQNDEQPVNVQPIPAPEILENNYGLASEEIQDVNRISVTISDPCPIVILFGAKTSGKTMALVRLTRYLHDNEKYTVEPDEAFRATTRAYGEMCKNFNNIVNDDNAAGGTSTIGFMLITVRNENSDPICQILEAPGEHYFDENDQNAPFPRYINDILTKTNRRIWLFIVERNWKSEGVRRAYADKIKSMLNIMPKKDKVIFICNKADLSRNLLLNNRPNTKQFKKDIKNQYPGIFTAYKSKRPFFSIDNYQFVAFSSGIFNDTLTGGQTYTPSEDFYPATLWAKIKKAIWGGWF